MYCKICDIAINQGEGSEKEEVDVIKNQSQLFIYTSIRKFTYAHVD
jgi:hypothetical protein